MSAGYVKPAEAERILGVDRRTLKTWASAGHIKFLQPGGKGQRLYDVSSVGVCSGNCSNERSCKGHLRTSFDS